MRSYVKRASAQAESRPRASGRNASSVRRKAGRANTHADRLGERPTHSARSGAQSAKRRPGHHPQGKEVKWLGDKRGPRHADLPRVPFTRRPEPGNHGLWLHYRVAPGLRGLRYVESRSRKNACVFVSKAKDREMWKMAKQQGHKNPAVMIIANLAKLCAAEMERRAAA
jgi:hypothetical protein